MTMLNLLVKSDTERIRDFNARILQFCVGEVADAELIQQGWHVSHIDLSIVEGQPMVAIYGEFPEDLEEQEEVPPRLAAKVIQCHSTGPGAAESTEAKCIKVIAPSDLHDPARPYNPVDAYLDELVGSVRSVVPELTVTVTGDHYAWIDDISQLDLDQFEEYRHAQTLDASKRSKVMEKLRVQRMYAPIKVSYQLIVFELDIEVVDGDSEDHGDIKGGDIKGDDIEGDDIEGDDIEDHGNDEDV